MKIFAKYFILLGVFMFWAMTANAEISVKDTTSPEFIHNAGYSPEISRLIEVKTKNPATPIPAKETSRAEDFKMYLWKFIDPAVDRPNTFADHHIHFQNSIEDL